MAKILDGDDRSPGGAGILKDGSDDGLVGMN